MKLNWNALIHTTYCTLTQKLPIHLILQSISSLANVVRRVRTRLAMHFCQASNILCSWNGSELSTVHSGVRGCATQKIYYFSPPKSINQLLIAFIGISKRFHFLGALAKAYFNLIASPAQNQCLEICTIQLHFPDLVVLK